MKESCSLLLSSATVLIAILMSVAATADTSVKDPSQQFSTIDVRKSSHNGGFLVEHLINKDDQKLAAAAGDYSGTFDERLSTGHFFVKKTESGYTIKAFSRPNHPQYSTSAAVDIMIFYKGAYVQVPTKSADMARFRKIVKDSGLRHEQSMESEEFAAYDMLLRYLSPQPAGDYFALPCPEGIACQTLPILEIYDLEVPLNLLNLMVYERYNQEINAQMEPEDIDGRNRLIAQYKSQILAALDHAASLSDLPPDADMQAWYDLQQRFKAIGFKQSYRSYWINKMGCEKKPDRSPLCKPEWANKLKDLLSNGLLTVDNGRCEQVPVIAFMEQIKSNSSHSLKSCGGIDLGEFAFDPVGYEYEFKMFDAYIEAESKKTAETLHALYRKILAKGWPIHAATNYIYEPTHDANGKRVDYLTKVFYHEFDVTKGAQYSVIDREGTFGPLDFLQNLKYHGPGDGSVLLLENTALYFQQFSNYYQLGSVFTVGGWPLHIIDMWAAEDYGGQIIPPLPVLDLED